MEMKNLWSSKVGMAAVFCANDSIAAGYVLFI